MLAGGIGSRFWPASTPARPKQLLPLGSERPLIVDTFERARALVPDERIRILAGQHLVEPFQGVLADVPEACYWIEPRARGTAPVLAWAAWKLRALDPDAVMISLHADHLIRPVEALVETVEIAVQVAAREGRLVAVGVEPARVETGYGHIEPGETLPGYGGRAHLVGAFHEKPDGPTAERYTESGFRWNTGIFVWKASVLLDEIERCAPDLASCLPLIDEDDAAFFDRCPVEVIDRAVMERSERVATVDASFEWDDVGSWEALARTGEKDARGNVMVGNGVTVDGSDNIVFAEGGEVVVLGASDLIVVRTPDRVVVLPRARVGEIKELVAELGRADS